MVEETGIARSRSRLGVATLWTGDAVMHQPRRLCGLCCPHAYDYYYHVVKRAVLALAAIHELLREAES